MSRALLLTLAACYQPAPDPCAGGGDVSLAIGAGEHDAWTVYADGDDVPMVFVDEYGFEISLSTTGLDSSEDATFVGLVAAGGEDVRDLVASGPLACLADGTGWMRVWVGLSSIDQEGEVALALDGEPLSLDMTIVDAGGLEAHGAVTLVIDTSTLP